MKYQQDSSSPATSYQVYLTFGTFIHSCLTQWWKCSLLYWPTLPSLPIFLLPCSHWHRNRSGSPSLIQITKQGTYHLSLILQAHQSVQMITLDPFTWLCEGKRAIKGIPSYHKQCMFHKPKRFQKAALTFLPSHLSMHKPANWGNGWANLAASFNA